MDLLFHQITIFILMMIYVPIAIAHTIFTIKEKGWFNRICYIVMASSLVINLPNVIKNYQQYLMGHFSGLPEVITTAQTVSNVVLIIIFVVVSFVTIRIAMETKRRQKW